MPPYCIVDRFVADVLRACRNRLLYLSCFRNTSPVLGIGQIGGSEFKGNRGRTKWGRLGGKKLKAKADMHTADCIAKPELTIWTEWNFFVAIKIHFYLRLLFSKQLKGPTLITTSVADIMHLIQRTLYYSKNSFFTDKFEIYVTRYKNMSRKQRGVIETARL